MELFLSVEIQIDLLVKKKVRYNSGGLLLFSYFFFKEYIG